jgi:uridine kinase
MSLTLEIEPAGGDFCGRFVRPPGRAWLCGCVDQLAALARAGESVLPGTRLVTIDGPAGAGKTDLAADLARSLGAAVIHMDDLYQGWTGLDEVLTQRLSAWVVTPLRHGLPATYLVYDWHRERFTSWRRPAPTGFLILEGVGAGQPGSGDVAVLRVWVEAPPDVCRERGVRRDGTDSAVHWGDWERLQAEHFHLYRTRDRCDVVIDTGADPATIVRAAVPGG